MRSRNGHRLEPAAKREARHSPAPAVRVIWPGGTELPKTRHIPMQNNQKGKPNSAEDPTGATSILERRRIAKVVHDERGNASVEWVKAPEEGERVALALEDTETTARPERGYDPYQKAAKARSGGPPSQQSGPGPSDRPGKPRDLRKLSEWIKQMRELEARKQRGDDPSEK
jgi:hypothetical protein